MIGAAVQAQFALAALPSIACFALALACKHIAFSMAIAVLRTVLHYPTTVASIIALIAFTCSNVRVAVPVGW
jgi:hypothetical protein